MDQSLVNKLFEQANQNSFGESGNYYHYMKLFFGARIAVIWKRESGKYFDTFTKIAEFKF